MRNVSLVFVLTALVACGGGGGDDDQSPSIDGPAAACADLRGTWGITGGCGADTCLIMQTGCSTELDCGGGASSFTGSVTGNQFMYSGTAGGGVPASCTGSVNGSAMNGNCTVAGAPCSFTGQRL